MILVLMGVSGAGKTTVGRLLADGLGWSFIDADDFHAQANIEKMRQGIPLDDDDRRPWLAALCTRVRQACTNHENVVLACSALKHSYQHYLEDAGSDCVYYVYLRGSEALIRARLAARTGHFMDPALLHSQFETLEPPEHALSVDIAPPPREIALHIQRELNLPPFQLPSSNSA